MDPAHYFAGVLCCAGCCKGCGIKVEHLSGPLVVTNGEQKGFFDE